MQSKDKGNRPDCAYYLLLSISIGIFLACLGGIFCWIAYNKAPQIETINVDGFENISQNLYNSSSKEEWKSAKIYGPILMHLAFSSSL